MSVPNLTTFKNYEFNDIDIVLLGVNLNILIVVATSIRVTKAPP